MDVARPFTPAQDGVDARTVPAFTLASGAQMPAIGLGTFGSDHASAEEIADAVLGAVEVGYRHIDCAAVYANEREIGAALRSVLEGGVAREELWITSKLWNDKHGEEDVLPACRQTLDDLGLDYLDLYLVHWPVPNHHARGVDVSWRNSQARPYIHVAYMRTWRQMERLVELGMVRQIGTSNMTEPKMRRLLEDARIRPVVEQTELHPHHQQGRYVEYLQSESILPVGYSPIGSPARPERDRTPEDSVDIEDPVVVAIAQRLGVHPAVVCLKWGVQRGTGVVPMSTKRRNYLANLQGVAGEPLTEADMQALAAIDRNCRLIKGQVFLWKEGQSREDLWDVTGEITPP
jgi:diketogulonate reductase-like aldo/keto reductase